METLYVKENGKFYVLNWQTSTWDPEPALPVTTPFLKTSVVELKRLSDRVGMRVLYTVGSYDWPIIRQTCPELAPDQIFLWGSTYSIEDAQLEWVSHTPNDAKLYYAWVKNQLKAQNIKVIEALTPQEKGKEITLMGIVNGNISYFDVGDVKMDKYGYQTRDGGSALTKREWTQWVYQTRKMVPLPRYIKRSIAIARKGLREWPAPSTPVQRRKIIKFGSARKEITFDSLSEYVKQTQEFREELVAEGREKAREMMAGAFGLSGKRPHGPNSAIGIEIEGMYTGDNKIRDIWRLTRASKGRITVTDDGSISRTLGDGVEFRVLIENGDYSVLDLLRSFPFAVDQSCGLHIHLDMRKETARSAYVATENLLRVLPALRHCVAPYRKTCQYARPNRGSLLQVLSSSNRYREINPTALRVHKTIEIRMKESTTNMDKVIQWAKMLDVIASMPSVISVKHVRAVSSLGRLVKMEVANV